MSTASATIVVTGVGFTPSGCNFIGGVTEGGDFIIWAFTEGTGSEEGYLALSGDGATVWARTDHSFSPRDSSSVNRQDINVTTLGSDGFTLTHTKVGTPSGTLTTTYECFD